MQVGKVFSNGETNRPGQNYWKGLLESLTGQRSRGRFTRGVRKEQRGLEGRLIIGLTKVMDFSNDAEEDL